MVFVLHGGGGADAEEMARRTGMNALADREGFLVVYPYGIDGQWNDGRGSTFRGAPDNSHVDDTGFISAILDELILSGEADASRIYAVGLSNGGMMTYRLGVELGDRLAAIAAIIANLPAKLADHKPARPIPVLIMNGTADPMMPWDGGPVRVLGRQFGEVLSTEDTVRYWVRAAGLPEIPSKLSLDDRVTDDHSSIELEIYRDPNRSLEVLLYKVIGGGHNLPGGQTPDRPRLLGPKNRDIHGMEEIWAFFKKHKLDRPRRRDDPVAKEREWRTKIEQVGDPAANYLNIEFTSDGRYMVWFEGTEDRSPDGIVWHCGLDPDSGALIPPDGRGFRAFESTSWARANPGDDAEGPYYVGADREGHLILVHPMSPFKGKITRLSAAPDLRRRAIYPTHLPERNGGFIFFYSEREYARRRHPQERQWVGGTPIFGYFRPWINSNDRPATNTTDGLYTHGCGLCAMDAPSSDPHFWLHVSIGQSRSMWLRC